MSRPTPLASILLPVRDAEATLAACLRSVVRQSEPDWECLVVDDGSRDASLACARAFAARDTRFRVVAAPRRGLVPALELGRHRCRGGIVVRMDADDLMHRRRIERQAGALAGDASLSAVGCHVRLFPRARLGTGMRAYERWLASIDSPDAVRREAFVECPIAHPTLAIRRAALDDLGYRDAGWPEDYDLVLRLLASGRRLGVVPVRLLCWRHGPARLSQTDPRYTAPRFTACKAAFLAKTFLGTAPRYVLWGYGSTGRALLRALREHGREPAAIVELHPRRLGNRIQGAPVVPPAWLAGGAPAPIVVSVAGAGARAEIRGALARMGFVELRDYVCAA